MKTTHLAISILLFSWTTSQAQDKKFDLGLYFFPNYSIGIISSDGSTPKRVESGFKEIETWKPSFSANIFLEYRLNQRSFLGLGMGYQNNGERTKKLDLNYGSNPNTGKSKRATHARIVYNHHNIEIALYYKHRFGRNFYGVMGTSGIINVSNTRTSILYFPDDSREKNTEKDKSTDFRKFNFSGNFGFGMNYLNKETFSLFVHPYIQYGILGISKSASLNRNILSLGISTGIKI